MKFGSALLSVMAMLCLGCGIAGRADAATTPAASIVSSISGTGSELQLIIPNDPTLSGPALRVPVKVINESKTADSVTLAVSVIQSMGKIQPSGASEFRQLLNYQAPATLAIKAADTTATMVSVPLNGMSLPQTGLRIQVKAYRSGDTATIAAQAMRDFSFSHASASLPAPQPHADRLKIIAVLAAIAAVLIGAAMLRKVLINKKRLSQTALLIIGIGVSAAIGVYGQTDFAQAGYANSCQGVSGGTYLCRAVSEFFPRNTIYSEAFKEQNGLTYAWAMFNTYPYNTMVWISDSVCMEGVPGACDSYQQSMTLTGSLTPCASSDSYLGGKYAVLYPPSTLTGGTFSINGISAGLDATGPGGYVHEEVTVFPNGLKEFDYYEIVCLAQSLFNGSGTMSLNGSVVDTIFADELPDVVTRIPPNTVPTVGLTASPPEVPSSDTSSTLTAAWSGNPDTITVKEIGGDGYSGTFTPNTNNKDTNPVSPSPLPNGATQKAVHTYTVTACNSAGCSAPATATITVDPPSALFGQLKFVCQPTESDCQGSADTVQSGSAVTLESIASSTNLPLQSLEIQRLDPASNTFGQAFSDVNESGQTADEKTQLNVTFGPGKYTYRLHVTDSAGGTFDSIPVNLTVAPPPSVPAAATLTVTPPSQKLGSPFQLSLVATNAISSYVTRTDASGNTVTSCPGNITATGGTCLDAPPAVGPYVYTGYACPSPGQANCAISSQAVIVGNAPVVTLAPSKQTASAVDLNATASNLNGSPLTSFDIQETKSDGTPLVPPVYVKQFTPDATGNIPVSGSVSAYPVPPGTTKYFVATAADGFGTGTSPIVRVTAQTPSAPVAVISPGYFCAGD